MRFIALVISCALIISSGYGEEKKKTICLNMIIKNESPVIERCLKSVLPIIDTWVIVDTGSTDGTQDIVRKFMKDIPGELHERPWINFGHNRNEALMLAKGKADYVLIIDADESLLYKPGFVLPALDKDFYYITTEYSGTTYVRNQLVKNSLNWKWIGVLHEVICCDQASTSETLQNIANYVRTDGNRSTDSQKYQKDAKLLETAMLENPTDTRNQFYLAQSYRDAEMHEESLLNYKKRIALGGWDEEVFWSHLQVGLLQETLKYTPEEIRKGYLTACEFRPTRAEPFYRLSFYNRSIGDFKSCYEAALKGLHLTSTSDLLFVEKWIYDYGLLLEYSIGAYWVEKYHEALLASLLLLKDPTLPQHVRECVERNLVWVNRKINEAQEKAKAASAKRPLEPQAKA